MVFSNIGSTKGKKIELNPTMFPSKKVGVSRSMSKYIGVSYYLANNKRRLV